ncbi:MAG TPA: hypothetical protein VKE95_04400 [Burkholderiales bacterium]|nr:hypothetical protein [Burkholderiales bacterium]
MSPVAIARVLAAATLLAHGVAHADIFHCVDAGIHIYRDSPCPSGTRTAGITVSTPVEPRARQDEVPRIEYERVVAQQTDGLRRIEDLEREVAELRTALQSVQVAAAPAVAAEAAYPALPVQQPTYVAVPVPEPVYTTLPAPVVIVQGGCQGRGCGHHRYPDHDGVDHRPARHAELRRDEAHSPGRRP